MGYGVVTRSVHFRVRERRCGVGAASKVAAGNAVGMEGHSILRRTAPNYTPGAANMPK